MQSLMLIKLFYLMLDTIYIEPLGVHGTNEFNCTHITFHRDSCILYSSELIVRL